MVAAVRRGRSLRSVAKEFGVSLHTVQRWLARAGDQRLDRVDWLDRSPGCRSSARRTSVAIEDEILSLRKTLKETSALGEYGAAALRRELLGHGRKDVPTVRTIGRILERRGALDGRRRVRRPPPPKGWHLPRVAAAQAELDSFDLVEGLVIRGGTQVEVLNGISLHGGLPGSWVRSAWSARNTLETLLEHWRAQGLPGYVQFDNDPRFQGSRRYADAFGRVTRACLQLGVTPVFAPPRETGFQAAIENYNGRWQTKVWSRFKHAALSDLRGRSGRFVEALIARSAPRLQDAPPRRPFPPDFRLDLQRPLQGTVVFLRRTNDSGEAELLGHRFQVDPHWLHRLVRAEVDLTKHRIRIYALRRREPAKHPLLTTIPYTPPQRAFRE